MTERSPMFFNYGPGALLEDGTRLYDLSTDPGQNSPIENSAHELRREALMTRLMAANQAPPEAFSRLGLPIAFTFRTDTLPYLQLWHDFRSHAGVLGIEPCTSAKTDGVEKVLQPAEIRRYEVSVCFKSGQLC